MKRDFQARFCGKVGVRLPCVTRLLITKLIIVIMYLDMRLFIWLFLSFICATVMGTLTHELGHYVVAEFLGYDADFHYGATGIVKGPVNGKPSDGFWITSGGPIQTMLTGSIGLLLILICRKSFSLSIALSGWQWFLVFIALFWLRQTANLWTWIGGYLLRGNFSGRGDEILLAKYLGLSNWLILTFTGLIGWTVLTIITFKVVPVKQRLTFLVSGLLGGIVGYILWLDVLGKVIIS